jgi:thiamine-phosphate pyrophosphorylase
MKPSVDWSLYLVADPQACRRRTVDEVVRLAVAGGATVVQLRDKKSSTREYLQQARRLHDVLAPLGVPLIVNDRVDVAMGAGCEGAHLGQSDMPADVARQLMGPDALVGLSVDTEDELLAADGEVVDYVGVGPVFATSTKSDAGAPLGARGLRRFRSRTGLVIVAIGGVQAANAAGVIRAGANGIAVVSAICSAEDPQRAAAALRSAVEVGRGRGAPSG